jgi:hypothetical protein
VALQRLRGVHETLARGIEAVGVARRPLLRPGLTTQELARGDAIDDGIEQGIRD